MYVEQILPHFDCFTLLFSQHNIVPSLVEFPIESMSVSRSIVVFGQ